MLNEVGFVIPMEHVLQTDVVMDTKEDLKNANKTKDYGITVT